MDAADLRLPSGRGRGFTLIELLVATAVLAVVLSMVYVGATGTLRLAKETESQCGLYAMAGIAMERIMDDLESAWVAHDGGASEPAGNRGGEKALFRGRSEALEGRPAGFLLFRTLAHLDFTPDGDGAVSGEVRYDVADGGEGAGLTLFREDKPVYGGIPSAGWPRWPLCEGLSGVRFLFRDAEGLTWDHWDSEGEEFGRRLPAVVTVELEFANPSAPEAPYRFRCSTNLPAAGKEDGGAEASK